MPNLSPPCFLHGIQKRHGRLQHEVQATDWCTLAHLSPSDSIASLPYPASMKKKLNWLPVPLLIDHSFWGHHVQRRHLAHDGVKYCLCLTSTLFQKKHSIGSSKVPADFGTPHTWSWKNEASVDWIHIKWISTGRIWPFCSLAVFEDLA